MSSVFRPAAIGALYTGITRGLSADILAARALDGLAQPICTCLVSASHGTVTDVLEVPTDSVAAQLEHLFETAPPNAARIGITGHHKTVDVIFDQLEALEGPVGLDVTLSGPSGEDVADQRVQNALTARFEEADLITLRRLDAQIMAGMEIDDLDDAQVAAQRLHNLGARRVLLRCGKLPRPQHQAGANGTNQEMALDLFYDGTDFSLFEAPYLQADGLHGASSGLVMPILRHLLDEKSVIEALQRAKVFVTEALRYSTVEEKGPAPYYFWQLAGEHSAS